MSWLLGGINVPASTKQRVRGLAHQSPSLLFEQSNELFYMAAGGHPETCLTSPKSSSEEGWAVVGLGLHPSGSSTSILSVDVWEKVLSDPPGPLASQNGHFVAFKWSNGAYSFFTDCLGIRTLYYTRRNGCILYSTRLDWLSHLSGHSSVDFNIFGSQWLTFNQLSSQCPITNIERLEAGGSIHISATGEMDTHATPWTPSWTPSSIADLSDALTPFTSPKFPSPYTLSLGLSGGLDSRLLLALSARSQFPETHTFGPASSADVHIASAIAEQINTKHHRFHETLPDTSSCLSLLRNNVAHNQGIVPASAVHGLHYFEALNHQEISIIDGGFGEIARRQFLNRVLYKGRHALLSEQFAKAIPLFFVARAPLFQDEINLIMRQGAINQLSLLWENLPSHKDIGFENKLDLLSLRTRLPNFFGYEQNRLDSQLLSYMPFAQPGVLERVFGLPLFNRKNGRAFRSLIRQHLPWLTQYPLAKGDETVPFGTPPLMATVWFKLKSKGSSRSTNKEQHNFLYRLKSYALDTLSSQHVREYSPYNMPLIEQKIQGYYKGDQTNASFVDWWLTFETWRQCISSGS